MPVYRRWGETERWGKEGGSVIRLSSDFRIEWRRSRPAERAPKERTNRKTTDCDRRKPATQRSLLTEEPPDLTARN